MMDTESDFFGDVLKRALGIALGLFVVWLGFEYYARYQVRQLQVAVDTSLQQMQRDQQQAAQRRQNAIQESKRADVAAQQMVHEQRQAVAAEERRKAGAWQEFFQPSAQCLATASIECGNQHMRARKEFERRYAAGEL